LEEKRKEEKIPPLRALSEEDKSLFGKKVPRKSLSFREKFTVRKGTVGLPKINSNLRSPSSRKAKRALQTGVFKGKIGQSEKNDSLHTAHL